MSIFKTLVSFVSKYGVELAKTADSIDTIVRSLPLDKGDKNRVLDAVNALRDSVTNIEKSLKKMKEPAPVKVSKADIEGAVKAILPAIVTALVREELDKASTIENVKSDAKTEKATL